ncbi:MAG: hypothetical protein EXR55_04590 [Dehalococcoidia bacterium]|nr:hypothetical protein [Dehalococcoidia bacterium]
MRSAFRALAWFALVLGTVQLARTLAQMAEYTGQGVHGLLYDVFVWLAYPFANFWVHFGLVLSFTAASIVLAWLVLRRLRREP